MDQHRKRWKGEKCENERRNGEEQKGKDRMEDKLINSGIDGREEKGGEGKTKRRDNRTKKTRQKKKKIKRRIHGKEKKKESMKKRRRKRTKETRIDKKKGQQKKTWRRKKNELGEYERSG